MAMNLRTVAARGVRSVAVVSGICFAALAGCSGGNGFGSASVNPALSETLEGGPDYPLFDQSMTWTGEELIIIGGAGGDLNDGLLVDDPMSWTRSGGFESIAKPPGVLRNRHSSLWTGDELMIWSGTSQPFGVVGGILDSAAAYDPATDRWRELSDSPDGLAKVLADGAMLGRTAVFAGGLGTTESNAAVALYDLDANEWGSVPLSGPAFAFTANDDVGFVLFEASPELSPEVRLGRLEVDGTSGSLAPVNLPPGYEDSGGQMGLAMIGGRLALLSERDETTLTLYFADAADSSEPLSWREQTLHDLSLSSSGLNRKIPILAYEEWLVVKDTFYLYWVDSNSGAVVHESLTSTEGCALTTGGAVAIPDGLVGIGGYCVEGLENGDENNLYGSYLFTSPAKPVDP